MKLLSCNIVLMISIVFYKINTEILQSVKSYLWDSVYLTSDEIVFKPKITD